MKPFIKKSYWLLNQYMFHTKLYSARVKTKYLLNVLYQRGEIKFICVNWKPSFVCLWFHSIQFRNLLIFLSRPGHTCAQSMNLGVVWPSDRSFYKSFQLLTGKVVKPKTVIEHFKISEDIVGVWKYSLIILALFQHCSYELEQPVRALQSYCPLRFFPLLIKFSDKETFFDEWNTSWKNVSKSLFSIKSENSDGKCFFHISNLGISPFKYSIDVILF